MLLADLVAASSEIRATRSRITKREVLAGVVRALEKDEIRIAVSYLAGTLPQGRIGLGYAAVYGIDVEPAPHAELTVADVDSRIGAIAAMSGRGSRERRAESLASLMGKATPEEQAFLRALMLHELRQGALEASMVEAIALVVDAEPGDVLRAVMLSGDLTEVAAVALAEGAAGLDRFRLTLFRPVLPMLARTTATVGEALERHSPASFEAKLDGARVQLHKNGDRVAMYTRNVRDVAGNLPDVVQAAQRLAATSAILDGEVIALAPDGTPLPFQTTMSRFGRSLDIDTMRATVPLTAFYFDCLQVEGEDFIDRPAAERRRALEGIVPPENLPLRIVSDDPAEAQHFYEEVLASGHEGVMAKSPEAPYSAGRRGSGWLKVKPTHTLDLVVLAVEWGSGRRKGSLSNLHLGARDPASGEFVMLGKTFKGLTDEMLAWQTERFLGLTTRRDRRVVHVRPEQVVEIAFDGIQASRRYPGGMALRFARVKAYRDDKSAEEADTIEAVRALFEG